MTLLHVTLLHNTNALDPWDAHAARTNTKLSHCWVVFAALRRCIHVLHRCIGILHVKLKLHIKFSTAATSKLPLVCTTHSSL